MRLSVWTVGLAVMIMAAVAGQAVGPILTGSTTGTVLLTVEQAVTLDPDYALGSNPAVEFVVGTGDSATTRDDTSTMFNVAIEMKQGQHVKVKLFLQNNTTACDCPDSGSAAAAILTLDYDHSLIDIEVNDIDNTSDVDVQEAHMGPSTWLLVVPSDAGGGTVSDGAGGGGIGGGGAGGGGEAADGVELSIRPHDDLKPGYYEFSGKIVQVSGG